MILKLSRHETHQCFYYNCKYISVYDDEAEFLYFGGDSILKIVTIKDIANNWSDYRYYLQGIHCLIRMMKGLDYNENFISIKGKTALKQIITKNDKLPKYIGNLLNHHITHAPDPINLNYLDLKEKLKYLKPSFIKSNGEIDITNIWIFFTSS